MQGAAFESISAWRQPMPAAMSVQRTRLADEVADRVVSIRPSRLCVIVDGYAASGKTCFGHVLTLCSTSTL